MSVLLIYPPHVRKIIDITQHFMGLHGSRSILPGDKLVYNVNHFKSYESKCKTSTWQQALSGADRAISLDYTWEDNPTDQDGVLRKNSTETTVSTSSN